MPRVLLARPNDFIVGPISHLLVRLGLEPAPIVTPEALASASFEDVVGAVVSMAVTSRMPLGFAEVISRLRARAPRLPLVATTLLREPDRVQAAIDLELQGLAPLVGGPFVADHPVAPHAVLVLRAADVDAPTPALEAALRRHFGLG